VDLADRDYMRERPRGSRGRRALLALVAVFVIGGAALAAGPWAKDWIDGRLGIAPPPSVTPQSGLYPRDDPWASYLAHESECPGGENADASPEAQERTMRCLISWARERAGRRPLRSSRVLAASALSKARDIERCQHFAHDACGKAPHAVAFEAGYPDVGWGENLYTATGPRRAPRPALDRWLNSPRHRRVLLDPRWTEQGVAVLPGRELDRDSALWVAHFGDRH
jgi:uncharacterized protein YkwD